MSSKNVAILSLAYLALPHTLFLAGWLDWAWAAPAMLVVGAATVAACVSIARGSDLATEGEESDAFATPRGFGAYMALAALAGVLWLYLAGVGGYGYQDSDWLKHEAVLKDLIAYRWPVIYEVYGAPAALVYYVAYYLPAALAGKWGGWGAANAVLFGWTWIGLWLALLWFALLVRRATAGVLLLFVLFAGLDVIGHLVTGPPEWLQLRHLERWSTFPLQYSADATSIFWSPPHALPGWICAGLAFYAAYRRAWGALALTLALAALWSPFALLGLLPMAAVAILGDRTAWRGLLRDRVIVLGAAALACIVGLFYAARLSPPARYLAVATPQGFMLNAVDLERNPGGNGGPGELLLFAALEFGLYLWLAAPVLRADVPRMRRLFWALMGTLLLLMLYRYGINNDLSMRATVPALFVLAATVGRALISPTLISPVISPAAVWRRGLLVALLLIGSVTAVYEFGRHITPFFVESAPWVVRPEERRESVVSLLEDEIGRLNQYIGSAEGPLFRYLAPSRVPPPDDERRYVNFGDKILFRALTLEPATAVQPGESVEARLELYVFGNVIDRNYSMALYLVGEDGREVWSEQGWPRNLPTSQTFADTLWYDTRTIEIPPGIANGHYRLDLSFVDPESGEKLAAAAVPSGEPLWEIVPVGYVTVGALDAEGAEGVTPLPERVTLGDAIAVAGVAILPEEGVQAGDPITVTVHWEATGVPAHDYTGFADVVDGAGRLVAQWDQPPRGDFLPTSLWRKGLLLDDAYTLDLPDDLPPGEYRVVGGMYDAATGTRLPVSVGGNASGDTFEIATVMVE